MHANATPGAVWMSRRRVTADAPVRVIKAQAGNVHLESYCFKSDEKGAIGEISKGAA